MQDRRRQIAWPTHCPIIAQFASPPRHMDRQVWGNGNNAHLHAWGRGMIIGDLDLDWAEQDPDYLARVKAFLVSGRQEPETMPDQPLPPIRAADGTTPDLAVK
jgi:hypothetical protein